MGLEELRAIVMTLIYASDPISRKHFSVQFYDYPDLYMDNLRERADKIIKRAQETE